MIDDGKKSRRFPVSTLLINKTRYALQAAVLIFYTKIQINWFPFIHVYIILDTNFSTYSYCWMYEGHYLLGLKNLRGPEGGGGSINCVRNLRQWKLIPTEMRFGFCAMHRRASAGLRNDDTLWLASNISLYHLCGQSEQAKEIPSPHLVNF